MNVIRKHETGINAGNFVLENESGTLICSLGESPVVFLRRVVSQKCVRRVEDVKYVVEVKESLIHNREGVNRNSLAVLSVPVTGPDMRIAMSVFKGDAFGDEHRLGLQEYRVGDQTGYVMTINGLLWDGQILHVKDIAA